MRSNDVSHGIRLFFACIFVRAKRILVTRPSASRNDMDVEMGNALADRVVDRDKRSLGAHGFLYPAREVLGVREQGSDQIVWNVGRSFVVIPGN